MAKRVLKRVFVTITFLLIVLLLGVSFWAYANKQLISDYLSSRTFEPTQEIAQITEKLELTDRGKIIFFASSPQILASDEFNENCRQSEHTGEGALLGCFSQRAIFLYLVDDARLKGIMEVTAAHELMHAVYDRMSPQQVSVMQKELLDLYHEVLVKNPELEKRMTVYSHLSDARFANELHSIFATEVVELPEWLETHYATWLQNRQVILNFFAGYSMLFEELQAQAEELSAQLQDLNLLIEGRMADYSLAVDLFNADWEDFKARNEAYEFSGRAEEFYALRADFDARREALDTERSAIEDLIADYEAQRGELKKLNHLTNELKNSMDSLPSNP